VIIYYRPIKDWPDGWREADRADAPWSPFKSTWESTLKLLDQELTFLGASEATLQLDTTEANCRADGGLRANAVVNHHGVILSFDSAKHGRLTYPCKAFDAPRDPWRQNVRAIALGLESLRRVERYGIADRGQQYAGYAEIGSGIPLGAAGLTMEQAASFIAAWAGDDVDGGDLLWDEHTAALATVRSAFKAAAAVLHPDNGGDPAMFDRLVKAKELLEANGK
jgi:hypothetical protein